MYNKEDYFEAVVNCLNEQRKRNELCDIVITVGGRDFNAHKSFLAASSDYFEAMLTSGFTESAKNKIEIEGNADTFETLLDFLYSGELDIDRLDTAESIHDVLEMACYMQIKPAIAACCENLGFIYTDYSPLDVEDTFDVAEALLFLLFAQNHHLPELETSSETFLGKHFEQLQMSEKFLQKANVDFLEGFLTGDKVAGDIEEEQVLKTVVSWLNYDWLNRSIYTHRLLQIVRLGLVQTKSIHDLINADMLAIPECRTLVDTVLKLKSTKSRAVLHETHPRLFATKTTIRAPVAISGSINGISNIQFYDVKEGCWTLLKQTLTLTTPPFCTDYLILVVDGLLYIASNERSRSFFCCYDPVINKMTTLPHKYCQYKDIQLVHSEGLIYFIHCQITTKIDCYDIAGRGWHSIACFPLPKQWDTVRYEVVVVEGNILVNAETCLDQHDKPVRSQYALYAYRKDSDTWELLLQETYNAGMNAFGQDVIPPPPLFFLHRDAWHRVKFSLAGDAKYVNGRTHGEEFRYQPTVNKLKFEMQDGVVRSVTVADEVAQDHIPVNNAGAFRIEDEVFISHNSMGDVWFVYNTGLRITPEQNSDVDVDSIGNSVMSTSYRYRSNFTYLTFDPCTLGAK